VLEVFGSEAELGENFFMRDAFAAGERCLGCLGLASFFRAHRLVVVRGAGQGAGKRIKDDFQEANDGGDLAGSHAVDQIMRVLFLVARTVCHGIEFIKESVEAWNEFFGVGGR
jgi:hypothetical protein